METGIKKEKPKRSKIALFSGIGAGIAAELIFLFMGKEISQYSEEVVPLTSSVVWWVTTIILSFIIGRSVTGKISGMPLKSLFIWEETKEES
jgi:hypothetical protein